MLAIVSGPLLAMGAALFTILLMLSCLTRGRALVVIRAGEIALAERDETVRLLLRDFEDQGADWLWETDAARRVVRASPRFCHAVGLDPIRINGMRSEEHTSELQSLMRISYAVFCLKK